MTKTTSEFNVFYVLFLFLSFDFVSDFDIRPARNTLKQV